jgi:hypothetical protein
VAGPGVQQKSKRPTSGKKVEGRNSMMIPSLDIEVKALAERARDYGEPVEWIGTIMLKEVIGGPLVYLHGTREDFRKLAAALYAEVLSRAVQVD